MFWSWSILEPQTSEDLMDRNARTTLTKSAAPRLKDTNLDPSDLHRVYLELLLMIRQMYQHCQLVHADLSEYNIL